MDCVKSGGRLLCVGGGNGLAVSDLTDDAVQTVPFSYIATNCPSQQGLSMSGTGDPAPGEQVDLVFLK